MEPVAWIRTRGLLLTKQALSRLSYTGERCLGSFFHGRKDSIAGALLLPSPRHGTRAKRDKPFRMVLGRSIATLRGFDANISRLASVASGVPLSLEGWLRAA